MIELGLILVIIILSVKLYMKNKHIKEISEQVNQILFQQKDLYVKQFKEGNLSILESEIVKLVNRLYEQNQLLVQDKVLLKQSLEDISHQIKTPLTSLNLIQERLKIADEQEIKYLLKQQQQLLDKIEWLVVSLLKMAQLDVGTIEFKKENINIKDFINDLMKPFEILIDIKELEIVVDNDSQTLKNIDYHWTLEALSNVLKNCVEHLSQQGIITITINHNPLYDEIIIQDNGKGISHEDLPHLFERFYKGHNATKQSVGIGLALSHMIIEKQNGTITVENTYPGVKFMIHFYHEVI
ncbi:sensor histidine kinase [Candidatus Stoquefichus massiliensis]|uniref:sensor histidine kinase n=1 Tax=Candidatus Stoquefichus massiliensis TaxID=1470350 RepID=UPI0004898256|nr:HAMP domain-containing sensor histidine kinase [Candidatus Stoquefichus massiliensis]